MARRGFGGERDRPDERFRRRRAFNRTSATATNRARRCRSRATALCRRRSPSGTTPARSQLSAGSSVESTRRWSRGCRCRGTAAASPRVPRGRRSSSLTRGMVSEHGGARWGGCRVAGVRLVLGEERVSTSLGRVLVVDPASTPLAAAGATRRSGSPSTACPAICGCRRPRVMSWGSARRRP
jgi:hypothetical protein